MHYFIISLLLLLFMHTSAQQKKVNRLDWKIAGQLPATGGQKALGVAGPVTGVHNNVLIVAGGANFPGNMPWMDGKKQYYDEGYVFSKDGDDSLRYHTSFRLPFRIAYPATCSTPEGLFVTGGENENGISNKTFLVQWDAAMERVTVLNLPELPLPLTNAAAVFHQNKVYVTGGESREDVSNGFFVLEPGIANPAWQKLPDLPKPVSHAVVVVAESGGEGCIYIIGGRKKNPGSTSHLYASTLQYKISARQWSEKGPLPYALSAGTGIAAGRGAVVLFGGDAGQTFHQTESLIAGIGKETDAEKKRQLNEEKARVQSTHPGFCRQVLLYDIKRDRWQKLDCMPFDAPVTTTAIRWNGAVFIPSGEIRAGVRSPHILSVRIKE